MKIAPKTHSSSSPDDTLARKEYDIIVAAEANDTDGVRKALEDDPETINQQEPKTRMTALHCAGANRNLEIAEILFEVTTPKVDPWMKDRWGRLPVDLALETGNTELIELFHKKMFSEDYTYDFDPLAPPDGILPVLTPKFGRKL